MSNIKAEKEKQWYIDAVSSSLILRGIYKDEVMQALEKYHLKQRLDKSLDFQMHYDVEDVADEIYNNFLAAS